MFLGERVREPRPSPPAGPTCCRFCDAPLTHTFVDLGLSPLCQTQIAPDRVKEKEPFYPLHAFVCTACFLVQIPEVVPPEQIFTDYAYFSSFSDSWLAHVRTYAREMTSLLSLNAGSRVIEVASNDGYLLQYFKEQGIPVLGIEPAENVAAAALKKGIPTISKFLGSRTASEIVKTHGQADLVIGNNVLAHVPNLRDFVSGLKILLKPGGTLTMEFPHLMQLIDGNQFDTIYHEHYSYLSFSTVERVFAAQGIVLVDVRELPTHGGSLRISGRFAESAKGRISDSVPRLREKEIQRGMGDLRYYDSFTQKVQETRRKILDFFAGAKSKGQRICGYGAAGKTNTLLNYCGIGTDMIDFVVDRNPHKQGHLLPGSRIPIRPPEALDAARPDYLFVGVWNLKDEIMAQTARIRQWGGKWVVPIPEVRVYE